MLKTLHSLAMLLFLTLLCLAVGQLSIFFMSEESLSWYYALHKPAWTVPNLVFPLIWMALYVLMAVSAWLVWRIKTPAYQNALIFWCVQLFFNALWTPFFFGQREILYGLAMIMLLWICVLTTTFLFFKHSKFAAFLMLLYLLCVTYVAVFNFTIWQINC